ncbi:MAG: hypothetical protein WCH99_07470 [Verrucomicrobiota bacterium]
MKQPTKLIRLLLLLKVSGMIAMPALAAETPFKQIYSERGIGNNLLEFQGKLVFTRWAGVSDVLYLYDDKRGAVAMHTTANGYGIDQIAAGPRSIYFVEVNRQDAQVPSTLWRCDGQQARQVATLWPPDNCNVGSYADGKAIAFTVLNNDQAVFAGWDSKAISQGCIWTSDGSESGTHPLEFTKRSSNFLHKMARVGQRVFFDINRDGLFMTDGLTVKRVMDSERVKSGLCPCQDRLACNIYEGKPGVNEAELFAVNQAGLAKPLASEQDKGPFQPQDFILVGDTVFFMAHEVGETYRLWAISAQGGTPRVVKKWATGSTELVNIVGATDQHVYFLVRNTGLELWCSDGTEGGTVKLTKLNKAPAFFAASGDKAFFDLPDAGTYSQQVAVSEGTPVSTRILPDGPRNPVNALVIGSSLYITDNKEINRYDFAK